MPCSPVHILAQSDAGGFPLAGYAAMAFLGLFAICAVAFWLWTLIDCLRNENPVGKEETQQKLIWVIVICILGWFGAALYFFIRRPKRLLLSSP